MIFQMLRCKGVKASLESGFKHEIVARPGVAVKDKRCVVELCAGTCRIAQACARAGVPSQSFEIERNRIEDICSKHFRCNFEINAKKNSYRAIWIGMTCASFSLARRGKPDYSGWPPPLRASDKSGIWGLGGLNQKDQWRVRLGNRLGMRVAWVIRMCRRYAIPVFLENPVKSRLWIFPPIARLLNHCSQDDYFDHCQYGSNHKKSTRVAVWNFESQMPFEKCSGKRGVCSKTGVKHVPLSGIDPESHEFRTARASAYPVSFATRWAQCMIAGTSL